MLSQVEDPVLANKNNWVKKKNVVLFQCFLELVVLYVDLNKNPETSNLALTSPYAQKKKAFNTETRFDFEFSERSCREVGLF